MRVLLCEGGVVGVGHVVVVDGYAFGQWCGCGAREWRWQVGRLADEFVSLEDGRDVVADGALCVGPAGASADGAGAVGMGGGEAEGERFKYLVRHGRQRTGP